MLATYCAGPTIDLSAIPIEAARAIASDYLAACGSGWTPPAVPATVHALPWGGEAHLYEPAGATIDAPLVIWLHGGGWVFGSAALHRPWALELAARGRCPIVDIDYPLAPEHGLEAIVARCIDIVAWCSHRFGTGRKIMLGGESAGATLALLAAARSVPPMDGIVAVCPLTDLRCDQAYPSRVTFDDPRLMQSWTEMAWFIDQLLAGKPRAAISLADRLSAQGYPPVSFILGEYDLLRDEGLALAAALGKSDVRIVDGAIHVSMEFGAATRAGNAMIDEIAIRIGKRC